MDESVPAGPRLALDAGIQSERQQIEWWEGVMVSPRWRPPPSRRPAELPLPGGRAEARVKLHPLLTGQMIGPKAWFLREPGRFAWRRAFGLGVKSEDWMDVPVPAFLVEHPARRPDPDRHRLPSVGRGQPAGEPRPARHD